jgi:hypothetical protein
LSTVASPPGEFLHVIELQHPARLAAVPVLAYERALISIALRDCASHMRGDAPALRAAGRLRPARLVRSTELALLELRNQSAKGANEHLGDVSRTDLMTEELLRVAQQLVIALADRELHGVSLWRQRRHFGSMAQ